MNMMSPKNMRMAPVKYSTTRCGGGMDRSGVSYPGGLDLETPSLTLQPGALRSVLNFECAQSGGYARVQGYERVDGQAAPSAATYTVVEVTAFVNVPSVGQTLSQASSGATGVIIAVSTSPTPYIAITQVAGAFDATGQVKVSSTVIGTATTTMVSISALVNAQYLSLAADSYRANIGAVPGSGKILGVVGMTFSNVDAVYAFRANSGNTAVDLFKSTSSGWSQVTFFNTVDFTQGTGATIQPADGTTLTQGGVTATIKRVMWQSGSWLSSGGTAVGTLVVTDPAGGNFSSGAAMTSDGLTVTLSGAQTAISFLPGGHFEFVKANFSGQLVTRRIYGCDGVNKCFEFDGTTVAPITTGLTTDAPNHIAFHKNYLFISQASSIFFCGVGTPYKWDSIDGGGEIATGDIVTAMLTLPGSQTTATLGVYLRSNTSFLYGTDPTTFNYVTFNTGLGALPYSAQNLFDTFVFDDLGVITLKTTLNWGNFLPTTLTKNILPFILQEREKLIASSVMRSKSQYRVFFSDGYGLWITMVNQQYLGAAVVQFPNPVFCVDEGENSLGTEITYFGSSDGNGYVYQMDVGTSFDGADIDAYMTLAWDAFNAPEIIKRYRAASIEIQGNAYAAFSFGYQLGYGTTKIAQPNSVLFSSDFSTAIWDSFTWDNFVWDGETLSPTRADVTGSAENIQITIASGTNYVDAYTINSVTHHYTPRRGLRV